MSLKKKIKQKVSASKPIDLLGGQVAKKIYEGDPFKLAKNTKSALIAIGRVVGWKSKGDRQKLHEKEGAVRQAQAATAAAADELEQKYSAGNLDPENQAAVDAYRHQQQMELRRSLAAMGATDSSGRLAGETAIDVGAAAKERNIREGWHVRAMRLQGMSEASISYIEKMNEADRESKMVNFANLMESVGTVVTATSLLGSDKG